MYACICTGMHAYACICTNYACICTNYACNMHAYAHNMHAYARTMHVVCMHRRFDVTSRDVTCYVTQRHISAYWTICYVTLRFFLSSKMKSHLTCLRPHIGSPWSFLRPKKWSFLKCFRHLRNLIQIFSGAIKWAEHVLRRFRTTYRFDYYVMTGENRALHRIL